MMSFLHLSQYRMTKLRFPKDYQILGIYIKHSDLNYYICNCVAQNWKTKFSTFFLNQPKNFNIYITICNIKHETTALQFTWAQGKLFLPQKCDEIILQQTAKFLLFKINLRLWKIICMNSVFYHLLYKWTSSQEPQNVTL